MADTLAAHTLLGVFVREVAAPVGACTTDGSWLTVHVGSGAAGAELRVRLVVRSTVHAHRFGGPVQERTAGGWADVDLERLLALVGGVLEDVAGPGTGRLRDEVRGSAATVAAVLAHRPDRAARPLPEPLASYVDSEQALLAGHPRHPAPKWRSGSGADWRRWSPEARTAFPLHWVAVRADAVREWGTGFDERLPGPPVPAGWRSLPLHPWQVRLMGTALRDAARRGDVLDVGPAGPLFCPTSSVRTLYQPDADVFVKTSLSVRITNCVRRSSVADLEGAVLRTRLLAGFRDPGLAIMAEPAARTVADPVLAGSVGTIVRTGVTGVLGPGQRCHLAGTLAAAEPDPAGTATRLGDVTDDPVAWWRRYVELLVPPVLRLWIEHGVATEPHLQNVLVVVGADGLPVRVVLRDLEGVRWRTDRHAALLGSLPPPLRTALAFTPERAAARVAYCLVVNNLGELATAVAAAAGVAERPLWEPVRAVVRAVAAELGEPDELVQLLAEPTVPAKGNLLLRWRGAEDPDAPHVPVPNPVRC